MNYESTSKQFIGQFELIAIKTVQHSRMFYTVIMYVGQLCSEAGKRRIKPDIFYYGITDDGYHRTPKTSRIRDFARYICDNRQSPTSIIINVQDTELNFRPFQGTYRFGLLTIPPEGKLYVIDGQHRLEGLRYIYDEIEKKVGKLDLECPVIVTNMSKYEEAFQFAIINRIQKGLRTELVDLVLRRISETEDQLRTRKLPKMISKDLGWKSVTMSITDNIKKTEIWKGKLQEPYEKKRPQNVSNLTAMVSSLAPPVEKFNVTVSQAENVSRTREAYWNTIGDLCPIATKQSVKSSVLMKTLRRGVMHLLFADRVKLTEGYRGDKMDRDTFRTILGKGNQYMTDSFWHEALVYGSSRSSVSNVYRLIKGSILSSYSDKEAKVRTLF